MTGSLKRRRVMPFVLALGVVSSVHAGRPRQHLGDQPTPTFRSGTTLIELDVRVTDRNGRFVDTLAPDDFDVYVDGQRHEISSFELVRHDAVPVAGPSASDVSTNDRGTHAGRLYVLVLDDLQTHPLRSDTVRAAARRFVERSVGPADRVAVVRTSGRLTGSQDFTNNQGQLIRAIDHFKGERVPPPPVPAPERLAGRPGDLAPPSSPPQSGAPHPAHPSLRNVNADEAQNAMVVFRSLRNWVAWMSGLTGRRKVLVLFSEGVSYDTTDVFRNVDAPLVEGYLRDTVGAAARHNVAIYAIDVRGLPTAKQGHIPTIPDEDFFSRESFRAKLALRALAGETGGFALTNSNDFEGAFERIVRESSTYYLIGLAASPSPAHTIHPIDVRVKREGVTVRSRRSYVSAPAGRPEVASMPTSARLDDLLRRALPQSGLSLSILAATLRPHTQPGSVVVAVELTTEPRQPTASHAPERASMRIVAVGKDGKVKTSRTMIMNQAAQDALSRVRAVLELPLRPGQYQLRAAAIAEHGSEGSVHHDLVVPDLTSKPIALGGPLLASAATNRVATSFATDDLKKTLPIVPTTSRTFRVGDELLVFSRVYASEPRPGATIVLTIQIARESGDPVFAHRESLTAAGVSVEGAPILTRVPLAALPPGQYVLLIDARSSLAPNEPLVRQVPLGIIP